MLTNRNFEYIIESALLREFCGRSDKMLDLKKLIDGSVDSVKFSTTIDDCDFVDETIKGSVVAEGEITNRSGLILLEGYMWPRLTVNCARCGRETEQTSCISLTAKITDKLANEDEDEFVLLVDSALDLDELVRSALILEMPSRFLCKADCKGLCPKCGCDLNESSCSCDTSDRDPRWDVLKDYFD